MPEDIQTNADETPENVDAAAAEVESAVPTVDPKDEIIEKLKADNDHLMRAVAEMQNIQKRMRTQAENDRKYAVENLALSLLPVLDSFEHTFAACMNGASSEAIADGVKVTDKQLRKVLEGVGVSRIVSLGAPFDPNHHEALATVDNEELDDETVVDEIEPGYLMHDRVIRPAKVRVSKKP